MEQRIAKENQQLQLKQQIMDLKILQASKTKIVSEKKLTYEKKKQAKDDARAINGLHPRHFFQKDGQ